MINSENLLLRLREQRVHKSREQVRFWANPEIYSKFKEALQRDNIMFIQDAFNEFMKWYIEQPPSPITKEIKDD